MTINKGKKEIKKTPQKTIRLLEQGPYESNPEKRILEGPINTPRMLDLSGDQAPAQKPQ